MSDGPGIATPSFTTAHDGDCGNCGAHIPTGITAGFVGDQLWCQPCRCELAAVQDLHIDELAVILAVRRNQQRHRQAWEQAVAFASRLTEQQP